MTGRSVARRRGRLLAALAGAVILCCLQATSFAQGDLLGGLDEPYPLRAADTSSPRDTLRSFLRDFAAFVETWRAGKPRAEVLRPMFRAADTLDLSEVATVGRESAVLTDLALLHEVLDRVELPQFEDIPGDAEVGTTPGVERWRVPNTKIEIVRIDEGERKGEYLFSRDTVRNLGSYYALARELPYKAGALVGIYDEILASPGQWLPQNLADRLPAWANIVIGGQGLWQWLALFVSVVAAIALSIALIRAGRRWDSADGEHGPWLRFGTPLALLATIGLAAGVDNLAGNAIGLLGLPLEVVSYGALAVEIICAAWLVASLSGRLAGALADTGVPHAQRRLDTALMRIVFQLISLTVMAILAIMAADAIGVPIAPLVAGLGVGGLAVALAIRPTLENVIGGLTLFADHPVRVGDFCRYGDQLGTVEAIGLRSTRIRTLENSVASVPNSEFSQMHIDNYSIRQMRLMKSVLQLRYETSAEQMRYLLVRLRELLVAHPMVLPQPSRVRFVGYGAYSKDVEIFAYLRCQTQDDFLAIQEDILLRVEDVVTAAGSGFAFPSQTAYVARDRGIDAEKAGAAAQEVETWRSEERLPFPDFHDEYSETIRDTLDYPPKGAPPRPQT